MKPSPALLLPLTLLLLLGGAVGCRKPNAQPDEVAGRTAVELVTTGEILLQNRKWEDGRKTLRLIEERLPSSPEFPRAKMLIADSFFFGSNTSFPEALVEYQSFLNYFPRDPRRDVVMYRMGQCHFAAIENAERDQNETRKALDAFQLLLKEAPGSIYAVDAKAKVTQCWRRIAESELMVGIFYVKSGHYGGAERRIKGLLETYPEFADRERAYFFLGEAMRQKRVESDLIKQVHKEFLAKIGKDDITPLTPTEGEAYGKAVTAMIEAETSKYTEEAKGFYKKLVESYPGGEWAGKAKDRLVEMGQAGVKEDLDS